MFVNIIKSYRHVVAICDSELLGKRFEKPSPLNPKVMQQLDVKESFYKGSQGKEATENEVLEIIQNFKREDATFNIVGKKSIACAIKSGLITQESVAEIQGVPYSLVLL